MKRIFAALALLTLAVASAAAIPPPTVTFTPSPVAPGGTVQISVQMKGNDNLPPVDHLITVDCQYYEENATNPTILPQVKSTLTVSGIPGALIKSVTWRMSLPPNFTYLTDPVSTGYMGATTIKGDGVLDFTATALLSGVTATTSWSMRAQ